VKNVVPMRYRTNLPEDFARRMERQEFYMELSDSDDDDKPGRVLKGKKSSGGVIGAGAGGGGGGGDGHGKPPAAPANKSQKFGTQPRAMFKRDKITIRERPISSSMFREIAQNDPELKVRLLITP
jgi:hypothetical protein